MVPSWLTRVTWEDRLPQKHFLVPTVALAVGTQALPATSAFLISLLCCYTTFQTGKLRLGTGNHVISLHWADVYASCSHQSAIRQL